MELKDTFSSTERQIWLKICRIDQENQLPSSNMGCEETDSKCWGVKVRSDMNSDTVRTLLRALFHIHGNNILRVRNNRGNLIPMNGQMEDSSCDNPHSLEVVRLHQHSAYEFVAPPYNERFRDLTKRKLDYNMRRMEYLERELRDSEFKQEDRVATELDKIQKKLLFLVKRFDIADSMNWMGMFKRNPFW